MIESVQQLGKDGGYRLDYPAVIRMAFPFMLNSAVQAVLNATDTWFVGRLSPIATAAIGAVYWPVLVFILLLGGVSLAVQTRVAHAYGGRRYRRAAQAAWLALWGALFTAPAFALLAIAGRPLFVPFGLAPVTLQMALDYWSPRMLGAPLGIALFGLLGFFNGIARPAITLGISVAVAILNALLNQILIFDVGLGVAGSAWATDGAQLAGSALALAVFLSPGMRRRHGSHLTGRFAAAPLLRQVALGFPMGVLFAADILGFALFQLMQVRLGNVDGAATQIVMMLTSFCYMPAIGIAMAGTTLVGQAIGSRNPGWASTAGNGIISLSVLYMGLVGILVAALGPWILPWFTNASAQEAADVIAEGRKLLWIAAGYQLFDGLSVSSSACLRGAGDVRLPSMMVLVLSWSLFVPLAHALSFAPGAGWVDWLPQYGLGAVGGWLAALVYICCLGTMLYLRWRSGAWRRVVLR